jgi:hypothetical protein
VLHAIMLTLSFMVSSTRTSGENIGDQGLIQSYRAWKAQYDDSFRAGNEYLLPALNYTRCASASFLLSDH